MKSFNRISVTDLNKKQYFSEVWHRYIKDRCAHLILNKGLKGLTGSRDYTQTIEFLRKVR